jgi:hypothetical protein
MELNIKPSGPNLKHKVLAKSSVNILLRKGIQIIAQFFFQSRSKRLRGWSVHLHSINGQKIASNLPMAFSY